MRHHHDIVGVLQYLIDYRLWLVGQRLVVVYPGHAHPDFHAVIRATNRLADYKRPKSYIPLVGAWPTTASGKLNVAGLVERVVAQLKVRR